MMDPSDVAKVKAEITTNARKLVELANDNDRSDQEYRVFSEREPDGVRVVVAQKSIGYKDKNVPYQVIMKGPIRDTYQNAMFTLLYEIKSLVAERSNSSEDSDSNVSDSAVSIGSLIAEIASMLAPIPPAQPLSAVDPDQEILERWAVEPLPYSPPEDPVFLNGVPVPSPLVINKTANSLSHARSVSKTTLDAQRPLSYAASLPHFGFQPNDPPDSQRNAAAHFSHAQGINSEKVSRRDTLVSQNARPLSYTGPSSYFENQPHNSSVVQEKLAAHVSHAQVSGPVTLSRRNTLPSGQFPALKGPSAQAKPYAERSTLPSRIRSATNNRLVPNRLFNNNRRRMNPFSRLTREQSDSGDEFNSQ